MLYIHARRLALKLRASHEQKCSDILLFSGIAAGLPRLWSTLKGVCSGGLGKIWADPRFKHNCHGLNIEAPRDCVHIHADCLYLAAEAEPKVSHITRDSGFSRDKGLHSMIWGERGLPISYHGSICRSRDKGSKLLLDGLFSLVALA